MTAVPPPPPDRPDLFVVVRVLDILRRNAAGMRKTPLAQAAGVNYTVFSRYLALLEDRDLVEVRAEEGGVERVVLTARGAESLSFLVQGIDRIVRAEERPASRDRR